MQSSIIPTANKIPYIHEIHNHRREDPYFWMREKDSEPVLAYLKAENAYAEEIMKPFKPLEEELYQEMVGRIKQTDLSVPYLYKGYYFYTRFEEGQEYPVYARKKGSLEAPEEILLDVNQLAEGHAFCDVTGLTVSPDNQWLAYGADFLSRRQYSMYIKNLATGEILPDVVLNTDGNFVWAADNKTLFYDVKDEETLRTYRIYKHHVGSDPESDTLVFEETDETFYCTTHKSRSEDFIFIISQSTLTSEVRYIRSDEPDAAWKIFQPRIRDHIYVLDHLNGKFYVTTNWEAKNFRMMEVAEDATERENWKEWIPHRKETLLESLELFHGFAAWIERENALSRIRIRSWDGSMDMYMEMNEPLYDISLQINPDPDSRLIRYNFTSLVTPNSVFDYNTDTREHTLLKQQEVVGGYDSRNYTQERIFVRAEDGVEIPVSIVYRNDFRKDGSGPLLQYGYGSYGISVDPYFSSVRLSLLDRGFAFAIAHIRGGEEKGRAWYEDGKLRKKKNTFTDFIAVSEYLIAEKYTSRNGLFAMGGSAGGLLMGAVANMRPDLYKGIIAAVPFVDVVTTMLDETIPLTTGEYDEWGNPNDPEYYAYIESYSPYDQVKAQEYPHILVTTGYHDSQVQYWEPAKWVARLRERKTDSNDLLFCCEMEAGHGGKSGRFQRIAEIARDYTFLLMHK